MNNDLELPGPDDLHKDLLEGAAEIAKHLFGETPKDKGRRKVYGLVERGRFPHFKLGGIIYARKSVVDQWIAQQERKNSGGG